MLYCPIGNGCCCGLLVPEFVEEVPPLLPDPFRLVRPTARPIMSPISSSTTIAMIIQVDRRQLTPPFFRL